MSLKKTILAPVRALVLEENRVLMSKFQLPDGTVYYSLPGGVQKPKETIERAAERECLEKTGYTVSVRRLAALLPKTEPEWTIKNDNVLVDYTMLYLFQCELDKPIKDAPSHTERWQTGIEWLKTSSLGDYDIRPGLLRENLHHFLNSKALLYLTLPTAVEQKP